MAAMAAALSADGQHVTVHTVSARAQDHRVGAAGYRLVGMPLVTSLDDACELDEDAAVAAGLRDFARFLYECWRDDRPDVVHAGSWIYGVAAQLAADRHRLPTVQSLPTLSHVAQQRQQRTLGPPARSRFERLLARSAARVVASCTDDVSELARLGCPTPRLSVLRRGVDLDLFDTAGPVAVRGEARRIVAIGSNLLSYKGFDDVVVALPRLRDTELILVGGPRAGHLADDQDVARLRGLATAYGVAGKVHFTGVLPWSRIPPLLRSADVLACPSWYESCGSPVVEAMACGVPIVASDAGSMRDTVIDQVTGILVPPRDPARLTLALHDVLGAGALRAGMGLAGRTRAQACFGWNRIASEATTIYAHAMEARGRTPAAT